jgi:hypothetical protein
MENNIHYTSQKEMLMIESMGVWQEVAMNSLKFHPGPPCHTLRPAGGSPATVFYPLGHPTPYTYVYKSKENAYDRK